MDQSDPFHLFPYRAIVDHPPVAWPNGAKVAVWVIPTNEELMIARHTGSLLKLN
jgi:acetate kinase